MVVPNAQKATSKRPRQRRLHQIALHQLKLRGNVNGPAHQYLYVINACVFLQQGDEMCSDEACGSGNGCFHELYVYV
jgi:hypothetical protein